MLDKEHFKRYLKELMLLYGKVDSVEVSKIYYEYFKSNNISIEQLYVGKNKLLANYKYKSFPTIADIMDNLASKNEITEYKLKRKFNEDYIIRGFDNNIFMLYPRKDKPQLICKNGKVYEYDGGAF